MSTRMTATTITPVTARISAGGPIHRLRAAFRRWQERSRIAEELSQMTSRELADLGLSAADIGDVARGNYRRG